MFIEFTTPPLVCGQVISSKFSENPPLCKKTLLFLLLALAINKKLWYA